YNTKEGLTSNAINTIYKDKKGELWFGTDTEGICKFNGKTFYRFEPK
ncbi:regulator, partial [Lacihabitans sp. CCS-44]|nr:regulator [Lacihabitans sp. CCS-44]